VLPFELPFFEIQKLFESQLHISIMKLLVIGVDCFASNVIPALRSEVDPKFPEHFV